MAKKIKIHYYSISSNIVGENIDTCLHTLNGLSIPQRTRRIKNNDVCLEKIEDHGSLWFLHFTALRNTNWPGAAQKGHASSDLRLAVGVELTENTFAAIDTNTGILVLQYTQSAVRASRLFYYLDDVTGRPNSFFYTPVLNKDAMERYERSNLFTEIEVMVEGITKADEEIFKGSSIASSVRESVKSNVTRLNVSFSVDARVKKNKIKNNFVSSLVDTLLARKSPKDKLIVKTKNEINGTLEAIDLLADVKVAEYPEKSITLTPGRRYRPDDMQKILFDALRR